MKFNYIGDSVSPGSVMEFNGNAQAGSGKIEMLKAIPNEVAEYKLTMIKPFFAEKLVAGDFETGISNLKRLVESQK